MKKHTEACPTLGQSHTGQRLELLVLRFEEERDLSSTPKLGLSRKKKKKIITKYQNLGHLDDYFSSVHDLLVWKFESHIRL